MPRAHPALLFLACVALSITACSIGPKYHRPETQVPTSFKELDGWKVAQPDDSTPRGPWWEIFEDAGLNALAAQVNVSNQNIIAAEARLRGARAAIQTARADFFPTVTTS